MRIMPLLLVAVLPLSSGCSMLIALSGRDISGLESREQVHAQFGTPTATGTAEAWQYEEFQTRRKIAEKGRASGLSLGLAMTFGLGELIAFPTEIALLMDRTVCGQTLRFWYDSTGTVAAVDLNGESMDLPGKPGIKRPRLPLDTKATAAEVPTPP